MTNRTYRLEVGRIQSQEWPWFERLARRMPSYKVANEDGIEMHVIETESLANLAGLLEIIRAWKGWAFYVDGRPATKKNLVDLIAQHQKPIALPKAPRPPELTTQQKQKEVAIKRHLDGWRKEDWNSLREQLEGEWTDAELRRLMEDALRSGEKT